MEKPRGKKKKAIIFRLSASIVPRIYHAMDHGCHGSWHDPLVHVMWKDPICFLRPHCAVWLWDDETEQPSYVDLQNHDETCTLCQLGPCVKSIPAELFPRTRPGAPLSTQEALSFLSFVQSKERNDNARDMQMSITQWLFAHSLTGKDIFNAQWCFNQVGYCDQTDSATSLTPITHLCL